MDTYFALQRAIPGEHSTLAINADAGATLLRQGSYRCMARQRRDFNQGLDARLVFGLPMIPAMEKSVKRAIGPMRAAACEVRFWHLADIDIDAEHVRSWG